jgi:hypothetical protein
MPESNKKKRRRRRTKGSTGSETEDTSVKMATGVEVINASTIKSPLLTKKGQQTSHNETCVPASLSGTVTSPKITTDVFSVNTDVPNSFQYNRPPMVRLPASLTPTYINPPKIITDELNAKIDFILSKVSKLDHIEAQQATIVTRLNTIESKIYQNTQQINTVNIKIQEVELSQSMLSDKYDSLICSSKDNNVAIEAIQGELKKVNDINKTLKKKNQDLQSDITDLRCRSMRDNIVILGISEHPQYIHDSPDSVYSMTTISESNNMQLDASPNDVVHTYTTDGHSAPIADSDHLIGSTNQQTRGSYASAAAPENCIAKVYQFCEQILNIKDAKSRISINRAHRMPNRPVTGKKRPIVINFKDTESKMVVKEALKHVDLRKTPFALFDQLPREVQEQRKRLIPIMEDARKKGHRAYLVREKLYINNVLYSPDSD